MFSFKRTDNKIQFTHLDPAWAYDRFHSGGTVRLGDSGWTLRVGKYTCYSMSDRQIYIGTNLTADNGTLTFMSVDTARSIEVLLDAWLLSVRGKINKAKADTASTGIARTPVFKLERKGSLGLVISDICPSIKSLPQNDRGAVYVDSTGWWVAPSSSRKVGVDRECRIISMPTCGDTTTEILFKDYSAADTVQVVLTRFLEFWTKRAYGSASDTVEENRPPTGELIKQLDSAMVRRTKYVEWTWSNCPDNDFVFLQIDRIDGIDPWRGKFHRVICDWTVVSEQEPGVSGDSRTLRIHGTAYVWDRKKFWVPVEQVEELDAVLTGLNEHICELANELNPERPANVQNITKQTNNKKESNIMANINVQKLIEKVKATRQAIIARAEEINAESRTKAIEQIDRMLAGERTDDKAITFVAKTRLDSTLEAFDNRLERLELLADPSVEESEGAEASYLSVKQAVKDGVLCINAVTLSVK